MPFDITKAAVLRPLSCTSSAFFELVELLLHAQWVCCNHGLQTRVDSYHACACTYVPQVAESQRGCMRSQLIGSLMNQAAGVFASDHRCWCPLPHKIFWVVVFFPEFRVSQIEV